MSCVHVRTLITTVCQTITTCKISPAAPPLLEEISPWAGIVHIWTIIVHLLCFNLQTKNNSIHLGRYSRKYTNVKYSHTHTHVQFCFGRISKKRTFGDSYDRFFMLDALPVVHPTVSRELKTSIWPKKSPTPYIGLVTVQCMAMIIVWPSNTLQCFKQLHVNISVQSLLVT